MSLFTKDGIRILSETMSPLEPQAAASGPGFWSNAWDQLKQMPGKMFYGMDNPELTPEENKQASRRAMMHGGLGMMHASNQGATFGQSLSSGMVTGQQSGQASQQAVIQANMEKQLAAQRRIMYQMMAGQQASPPQAGGGGPALMNVAGHETPYRPRGPHPLWRGR